MKFRALQENLRKELLKRVEAGELTGLKLAAMTGFQQAHISNFLNKKRGLSIEGMDKVLQVQKISVLDLLDPAEVSKRATIPAPSPDDFDNVLLVEPAIAATKELVISEEVKDILKFKKAFLKRLKADTAAARQEWTRFLLIKADGND